MAKEIGGIVILFLILASIPQAARGRLALKCCNPSSFLVGHGRNPKADNILEFEVLRSENVALRGILREALLNMDGLAESAERIKRRVEGQLAKLS